jgi:hypothetical protein
MACSNGQLSRYIVQVQRGDCIPATFPAALETLFPADGSKYSIPGITKISGVSLGEEGEVELPEWDQVGLISDGKRKLTTINMSLRVDGSLSPGVMSGATTNDVERLAAWFANRHLVSAHIYIWITNKGWEVQRGYKAVDASFKAFKEPDRELGASVLDVIDLQFSPKDMQLIACDGTTKIVAAPTPAGSLTFC